MTDEFHGGLCWLHSNIQWTITVMKVSLVPKLCISDRPVASPLRCLITQEIVSKLNLGSLTDFQWPCMSSEDQEILSKRLILRFYKLFIMSATYVGGYSSVNALPESLVRNIKISNYLSNFSTGIKLDKPDSILDPFLYLSWGRHIVVV